MLITSFHVEAFLSVVGWNVLWIMKYVFGYELVLDRKWNHSM